MSGVSTHECLHRRDREVEHTWNTGGIYVAYGWLATIILAFTDAVRAIREGPQPEPQPVMPETRS